MYQLYNTEGSLFSCSYTLYNPATNHCYGFQELDSLMFAIERLTNDDCWTYFDPSSHDPCEFLFEINPQDCPELYL